MQNREELIRKIQQLEFAVLDLTLYLDTHPNCTQAIAQFNFFVQNLQYVKRMYEMQFGPFANFGYSFSNCPWSWTDQPWPWENESR